MQRIIAVVVVLVAVGAVIFALNRPEPTPAERLSEAADEAGQAAQDAIEELSDAAEETVAAVQKDAEAKAEEIQNSAAEAMDSLSAELNAASEETRKELDRLMQDWRETGIVTDEGIDYDAAMTAVDETEMDADTKTEVNKVLAFIRDLPGEAKAKLDALEQSL